MTLADSLAASAGSDLNHVSRHQILVAFSSPLEQIQSSHPLARKLQMMRAEVTVVLRSNAWGPGRSEEKMRNEIALSFQHCPNETLNCDRADRPVCLLGIAHRRL